MFLFNYFLDFVTVFYSSVLSVLIQLLLLFYFVLYPDWITYPPQDPIIRSSAVQKTDGRLVPVLGSTPSAVTLLGSYRELTEFHPINMVLGNNCFSLCHTKHILNTACVSVQRFVLLHQMLYTVTTIFYMVIRAFKKLPA